MGAQVAPPAADKPVRVCASSRTASPQKFMPTVTFVCRFRAALLQGLGILACLAGLGACAAVQAQDETVDRNSWLASASASSAPTPPAASPVPAPVPACAPARFQTLENA